MSLDLMVFILDIICLDNRWGVNNLNEYCDITTNWIAFHVQKNNVTYTKTNSFRIQAYDSLMCRYFCIRFIDFIFNKVLLIFFHQIT